VGVVMEMKEKKGIKVRSTVYVTADKQQLAKERGYNLSKITEQALSAILDIENDNEVIVQRKIQEIEDKIQELKLQRKILIDELEQGRIKEKAIAEKLEVTRAFNDTVKEMKDTMDIRKETLETNAAIMGITPEELYNKAAIQAGWKSE
jgi:hypothetical protein